MRDFSYEVEPRCNCSHLLFEPFPACNSTGFPHLDKPIGNGSESQCYCKLTLGEIKQVLQRS